MYEIEIREREPASALVRRAEVAVPALGDWIGETYGLVMRRVQESGVAPVGMPFARSRPLHDGVFDVEAGIAVSGSLDPGGSLEVTTLPGGPVAVAAYVGRYDGVAAAYDELQAWLAEHGREPSDVPWEEYLTDPDEEPDQSRHRTDVVQPIR